MTEKLGNESINQTAQRIADELLASNEAFAEDVRQAERARIRAQVERLRDEAQAKYDAIINYDAKQFWQGKKMAFAAILDLLAAADGEATHGE